ncbi:MAG: hypothetical protein AAGG81_04785 [Chlamydiota bacterium]
MLYRVILFLLLGGSLYGEVELIFLPNKSTQQKSILTIELQQYLPGVNMHATMEHKLLADVKIVDRSDLPVSHPPLNMLFTLKDLSVNLRANDKEAEYQVNKPNTSLFLAEVEDMVGKPIKLYFNEQFRLMPHTPGLLQLSKELPILNQIHPQSLIEELFQHQFAIAGRSLIKDESYVVEINDVVGLQPNSITYTVKEINNKEIIADIKGELSKSSINLGVEIPIGDEMQEVVRLVVEGDLSGTVRWNRSNALIYSLETTTNYHGIYQIVDWEWSMHLTIKHQVNAS